MLKEYNCYLLYVNLKNSWREDRICFRGDRLYSGDPGDCRLDNDSEKLFLEVKALDGDTDCTSVYFLLYNTNSE